MIRNKIDYGIDLGTTNSAICRMEQGKPTVIKTDTLKDTMPSCIAFTKKGLIKAGDTAYNALKSDKCKATKDPMYLTNAFVEFKRTMGTDTKYHSTNTDRDYSSEELSSEVLKTLKSFVLDEIVSSAVITVPAKFTVNQKDATMRAAKLAGFTTCELLQEPIAAAMAYGLKADNKDAYWMVFDFGGGTFDAALLKVEDGIIQVQDTEGDNFLGGKNLDYAIVDDIIIPYLKENFVVENILADNDKKKILRDSMKTFAEPIKNQLSFKYKEDVVSDLGELGEDDEGAELELDMTITQDDLKRVLTPIFQKAIDICKELLKRNNLTGGQLASLILVGGPTHSPILRQMLKEQITSNVDTSVDPMTVVATGAALYASTLDTDAKVTDLKQGTIVFDLDYEATTVETDTWTTIKLNKEKSTGKIPSSVYVEFTRQDNAWSSGKSQITEKGDVVECILKEGIVNTFTIAAYDEQGNRLNCFPSEISVNQGLKVGSATLPYNISIGVYDEDRETNVISYVKGLERNKQLPAVGTENRYKTSIELRSGNTEDKMVIPIYQADDGADGIKTLYYDEVYKFEITGNDVPSLVPVNSDVEITIKADRSEMMTISVYIPIIDYTIDKEFDKTAKASVKQSDLQDQIRNTKQEISRISKKGIDVLEYNKEIESIEKDFANGNQAEQIQHSIRELSRKLDKYDIGGSLDDLIKNLDDILGEIKKKQEERSTDEFNAEIVSINQEAIQAKQLKDKVLLKKVYEDARFLYIRMDLVKFYGYWLVNWDQNFDNYEWRDKTSARELINKGLTILITDPDENILGAICNQINDLLPDYQKTNGTLH
ncbi:MAG: Hsp70 family protein [Bacteroidales bacterium]|nr:Hsp70 family protein [Bacteroidales bacterium]